MQDIFASSLSPGTNIQVIRKRATTSHYTTYSEMDQQAPLEGLSSLLKQIYNVPRSEVSRSDPFRRLQSHKWDKMDILSAIPCTAPDAERSLHLLYALLTQLPGAWPTIPLIRCYARLSKLLPEALKCNPESEVATLMHATSRVIKSSYDSFSDFICRDSRPALRTTSPDQFITHRGLHNFVTNFPLALEPAGRKPVVAIALPNGPLLAAMCIAVTTYYTAAPINPSAGSDQFCADVLQSGARVILTSSQDYEKLQLKDEWVQNEKIQVYIVDWNGRDDIRLLNTTGQALESRSPRPSPNQADDIGLILFTSGTSGTKKVVPLTLHSIIAGVGFVMDSWGLKESDTCLNMMPLYHV